MRTLIRIMIVFVVVNLLTSGFASAQTAPAPAESPSVPVSATSPASTEDTRMDDLLVSMSIPPSGRGMFGGSGTNSVLVIPNQEIKTEELLTINEDMNVMSRIFGNELNQTRLASTQRNWMFTGENWASGFFGRGSSTPQGMYLQGYGALFAMKVDFPLSAGPEVQEQEEQETEKEDVDQIWQQTRQQIYEPQETSRRRRGAERDQVKYDPEKVENFKTILIKALKHAANIRALKTDESVILSITGRGVSDGIIRILELPGTGQTMVIKESGGKKVTRVYTGGLPDEVGLSSPTVLVMRAKKSDIDTFAKGDLDFEQFRQRVVILSFPLIGANVSGTSTSLVLPTSRSTGTRF